MILSTVIYDFLSPLEQTETCIMPLGLTWFAAPVRALLARKDVEVMMMLFLV